MIDRFADELAQEVYRCVNPEKLVDIDLKQESTKLSKQQKKIHKTLNNLVHTASIRINDFKSMHRLGIYGKARLHLKFKERLLEMGYEEKFVKDINHSLLLKTP